MACNCPESLKPDLKRDWVIVDSRKNKGFFALKTQEASNFSTLECRKCLHKWRAIITKRQKYKRK